MEAALCEQAGNNSFSRYHHTESDCRQQDQELLRQVAAGETTHPAAGDDGAAHYSRSAGLSEARRRRLHAASRRQTPLAHRDDQIPQAVRAASAASTATTAREARQES